MTGHSPRRTNQVKGILLEEAVLLLLQNAGYRLVEDVGGDPTLSTCAAGLQVHGRGAEHQIDAIADYTIAHPFTYPQRLLVEAKCYALHREVDLTIVRNALGVFRDVAEYWTTPPGTGSQARRRYSYQYAVFATSAFTAPAQRFAFAHDINLLPLGQSTFFAPITAAIEQAARSIVLSIADVPITLSAVRTTARSRLRRQFNTTDDVVFGDSVDTVARACQVVREAYFAMAGGVFPIFLVPSLDVDVLTLRPGHLVRFTFEREGSWLIRDAETDRTLFSFDLPLELFALYAESGALTRRGALQLKQEFFSELQFISVRGGVPRLVTLRLDYQWLEHLRDVARGRR